MNPLRIAVIGTGHLGKIHTRLLRQQTDAELVAVVDPDPNVRESVAAEFRVPGLVHHGELRGRIDAAVVATTTDSHYEVARDLLADGVHVLVEKPITARVAEADELVALADERNCVLQVGHVERFNPAWRAVASYVRRPRYIEAARTSSYTFRSTDVSVVLDLMIHDLDLVLSLVRSPLVDLDAIGGTIFGPHEDMAHAHLRFANGCIANLTASRTSFEAQRTMQVITDLSYAAVDFARPAAKVIRPKDIVVKGQLDVHQLSPQEQEQMRENLFKDVLPLQDVAVNSCNAILEEHRDFVGAIRHGHRPRVPGRQGRDCLALAQQILENIAAKSRNVPSRTADESQSQWTKSADRRKAG